ncbi:MAG: hypothetical protein ACLP7W_03185 [Solirubrobacteraceae bacterium]
MSFRTIAVQAILLIVNLLAMSVLSSPLTARWYGASIAFISVALLMLSCWWTAPTHRRGPLRAGIWPVIIVAVPWLVGTSHAGGLLWSPHWRAGIARRDLDAALTIVIGSTTAFAAIYLSSLVDAAYIRPLVSGRGRGCNAAMPCQSSMSERWKGLTARWLMHRLLATLGFVLGLTVVVTITVKHWIVTNENQTTAAGIAAAATLLAGFYLTRARSVIAFAPNPALHVGDAVELIDEGTQHVRRYYVQDVALEGIKLLELTDEDRTPKENDPIWPSHDRMLDLPDVLRVLRTRKRFTPCGKCAAQCKRVNPYCQFKKEIETAMCAAPHSPPDATTGDVRQ